MLPLCGQHHLTYRTLGIVNGVGTEEVQITSPTVISSLRLLGKRIPASLHLHKEGAAVLLLGGMKDPDLTDLSEPHHESFLLRILFRSQPETGLKNIHYSKSCRTSWLKVTMYKK